MRVYQVNVVCGSGSTGRIAVDLAKQIETEGGQCRIAYGRGAASADVDSYKIAKKWEVYFHVLMTRVTDRHGLYSKRATKRLIKDIRKYAPDVIHLHNIHGYYLNYEILFAFLEEYGKPVKWTLHDCWAFTGHCVHYGKIGNYQECNKWKRQCELCDRRREYPQSLMDNSRQNYMSKKNVFTKVDDLTIVAVSEWLKQQVELSFLNKYTSRVVYNGIDLQDFKPCVEVQDKLRNKYHLQDKIVILGVANVWSLLKGKQDFIELSKLLRDNYQIVLIGCSERSLKECPPNVLMLPRTQNIKELAGWYSIAEVYFNASRAETFGMTVLESLACGTPVVAYNICAMNELITDGCGFLVDEIGNVQKVFEKIMQCKKEEMKKRCLERSAFFEKNAQYREYISMYKSCNDCKKDMNFDEG